MRRAILSCFLIGLNFGLFAQQKPTVISRDTINIHGFIYDSDGKAVKLAHIRSAQLETEHNYFKADAYADASGYFYLKGAKANDTLTIDPDIRYTLHPYYNLGSRFLIIYLPAAKVTNINAGSPFEIIQKRRVLKVTPKFTIQPFTDAGNINSVSSPATYPGGIVQLESFIKQNLVYPEKALKNNLEGTVELEFTVNDEGKITNIKVLKGITADCDDEVIRVLKKAAKWKPALNADRPVPSLQSISVLFKLTDN